jgi:flagellar motor protein MotB
LIKNGVSPEQVGAVGRGDTMQLGDDKAANRRTEILADPDLKNIIKN